MKRSDPTYHRADMYQEWDDDECVDDSYRWPDLLTAIFVGGILGVAIYGFFFS